jgi:hypothetical protein
VQTERLVLAVMGSKELAIEGLLDLIQNNQSSDSCRYLSLYQQYVRLFPADGSFKVEFLDVCTARLKIKIIL